MSGMTEQSTGTKGSAFFSWVRHAINRLLDLTYRALRILLLLNVVLLSAALICTALHGYLHTCPFFFKRFSDAEVVQMVYGLPMTEAFERAERGEIVLGGCMVGPVGGVCPHCHWPCQWVDLEKYIGEESNGP